MIIALVFISILGLVIIAIGGYLGFIDKNEND